HIGHAPYGDAQLRQGFAHPLQRDARRPRAVLLGDILVFRELDGFHETGFLLLVVEPLLRRGRMPSAVGVKPRLNVVAAVDHYLTYGVLDRPADRKSAV